MKTCIECKVEKPLDSFRRSSEFTFRSKCNKCLDLDRRGLESEIRQYIYDYLKEHHCEECGESRIPTLQFDHKDRTEKSFTLARAYRRSLTLAKIEIEKCRVLCANCHAMRTAEQFGWYKDRI